MIATTSVCKLCRSAKTLWKTVSQKPLLHQHSRDEPVVWLWVNHTRDKLYAALVSRNNHCEHHFQVHGGEGLGPQTSCGLEFWRTAASGHKPFVPYLWALPFLYWSLYLVKRGSKPTESPKEFTLGPVWLVTFLFIALIMPIVTSSQDQAKGTCLWKMGLLWKLLGIFCVSVCDCNSIKPA